jgi:16S rRNA C1402 N4-methylase RsmH
MDANLAVVIVAASASMVPAIFGMWINASQMGKRIDDLRVEFQAFRVEIKAELKDLRTELAAFRNLVKRETARY